MIYEVWKDAEGKYHEITEMDTEYIKNCIKQIESAIRCFDVKTNEGRETEDDGEFNPFSKKWSKKFANGFLDAFKAELNNRK